VGAPELTRQDGPWLIIRVSAGEVWILAGMPPMLSGFVDVEFRTDDGRRFLGTVGTVNDITEAFERSKATGEGLGGRYFWTTDLVIVDVIDPATIAAVVDDLVNTSQLASAFAEA
jgi:hypothetical protein